MIYKTLNHGSELTFAAHIFFPLSRSQERRQPESIRSIEQLAELLRRNKTINGIKEEGAENTNLLFVDNLLIQGNPGLHVSTSPTCFVGFVFMSCLCTGELFLSGTLNLPVSIS